MAVCALGALLSSERCNGNGNGSQVNESTNSRGRWGQAVGANATVEQVRRMDGALLAVGALSDVLKNKVP